MDEAIAREGAGDTVEISLPVGQCARRRSGTGEEFNVVRLPKGLEVREAASEDGRELGAVNLTGYTFNPRYVDVPAAQTGSATMTYRAQRKIRLHHSTRRPDGSWLRDPDIIVSAGELSAACERWAEEQARLEERRASRVSLTFDAGSVRKLDSRGGGTFFSVEVPAGVVVRRARDRDGRDLPGAVDVGGYTYNPKYMSAGPKEGQLTAQLSPDATVWLRRYLRDERGRIVRDDAGRSVVSGFVMTKARELGRALDVARGRATSQARLGSTLTREEYEALPVGIRYAGQAEKGGARRG